MTILYMLCHVVIPIVIACVGCAWCGYKICEGEMKPIITQLENDISDIKAGQRQLCHHLHLKLNGDTFVAGSAKHPRGITFYINTITGDIHKRKEIQNESSGKGL